MTTLTQACAMLKTVVNGTLYLQIESFQCFCNMHVRHAMILVAAHII